MVGRAVLLEMGDGFRKRDALKMEKMIPLPPVLQLSTEPNIIHNQPLKIHKQSSKTIKKEKDPSGLSHHSASS